ncbi:hypothetical protein DXA95_04680 [Odoribacter sp. OF09-27XD]|nr:hypothetical protein DXA95_04680 [Odoribacter sp. OF09-27XD]
MCNIYTKEPHKFESISAPTLQELTEMMPKFIFNHLNLIIRRKYDGSWIIEYEGEIRFENDLLLAVYGMICWLAENKLLGKEVMNEHNKTM